MNLFHFNIIHNWSKPLLIVLFLKFVIYSYLMNFDFNNVSPVFTFLICDVKAQRPNVWKKKPNRQVPFYGFQSLLLGFCFFKSFVDIKRLSCIRSGITSVCFALSLLKEHWLVHVNRCKSYRSFKLKVWWTGQGYTAGIMCSR